MIKADNVVHNQSQGQLYIVSIPSHRFRILIVNRDQLMQKGFSETQTQTFISAYSNEIDRNQIANVTKGFAWPLLSPFPPASLFCSSQTAPCRSLDSMLVKVDREPQDADSLPPARLTILTEPDPYSDLIAALLPKSIGKVSIDYKGMAKATLLDALIKGEFDIASILIEATISSSEFWRSFFTPGNPFTVFGRRSRESILQTCGTKMVLWRLAR